MTDDHAARAMDLSLALQAFHRALLHAEIGGDPAYDSPYTKLFALIGEPGRLDALREEARALLGEGKLKPDDTFRLRHLMALQKEPDVGLATGRLRKVLAGRS